MQALTRLFTSMTFAADSLSRPRLRSAAYSVTNGGFDAQDATVNNNPTVTPTGWFNASNDVNTFSDNILNARSGSTSARTSRSPMPPAPPLADGTRMVLPWGANAPFGNDGSLDELMCISKLAPMPARRRWELPASFTTDTARFQNQAGNFDVSIYYTSPGGFTPAVATTLVILAH